MTQTKLRLHPYKILALLLYGDYEWVVWDGPQATIKLGGLSRLLRIQSERLREHLSWLAERGYLASCTFDSGMASVEVRMPPRIVDRREAQVLASLPARPEPSGSWAMLQSSPPQDESVIVPVDKPASLW